MGRCQESEAFNTKYTSENIAREIQDGKYKSDKINWGTQKLENTMREIQIGE